MKTSNLLFIFSLLLSVSLQAQETCTGNLGENIFEDGDFGSGTADILLTDPGIAPGYIYTTSPPPNDGFYTITNNMAIWSFVFQNWLTVSDNSDNPNGYMMVVNASYETGAFYDKTIDGLCENTLYEFSADIINLIEPGANGFIFPNVSFLINNLIQYTTGDVPQNGVWNTYGFTFTTGPGETSVQLTLRNNASGGFGNDLALDNISFRACGPEALILPFEIENICEDGEPIPLFATVAGDQYTDPAFQWQQSFNEGQSWENISGANSPTFMHTDLSAGYYYYRYLLANTEENLLNSKCRVVSNVKIVFVQPKFYSITDTICTGLSYMVGNSEYDASGVFTDSLTSSLGCDSIITLNLTVVPDLGITSTISTTPPLCPGYEDGSIQINNVSNAYLPYEIFLNGQANPGTSGIFPGLATNNYNIQIVDYFGCQLDTMVNVPESASFLLDLGEDQAVNLGQGIQLSGIEDISSTQISWTPEEGVICDDDCLNPFILPPQSANYVLTITTDAGCTISDSIFITVNEVREVYIPTAFSPNDDGRNDHFTVYANSPNVSAVTSLQVFNRWGALVFEAIDLPPNAPSQGWDGNYKGEVAGGDVFAYVAKVRFLDGRTIIYTGDVHLIR
jgi:gliding motility-associated-like protein